MEEALPKIDACSLMQPENNAFSTQIGQVRNFSAAIWFKFAFIALLYEKIGVMDLSFSVFLAIKHHCNS